MRRSPLPAGNGHRQDVPRQAVQDSIEQDSNRAVVYLKPRLVQLLRALGLDVAYHRGAGDYLYYQDGAGREVEVLDLVGGYGCLLLGHAHPALVAEAQQLLASGRPFHTQGSLRQYGERLAGELSRRAGGDYCAVFTNSGAEAVEAALKHALLESGAGTFLALEGAFHGKTLAALQLTGNAQYRAPFPLPGLNVVRVRRNDMRHLEAAFQTADLAGLFLEPILGEGGVWPVEPAFAQRAARLCAERGIPLILDECQTGLGRTGSFLACQAWGIRPDYLILSKALGGGLAKIAALLVRRDRYQDVFDLQHTSTYAEDDYSCALALKTLELIDQSVLDRCREIGEQLLCRLRELQERYPDVIADVRGRGLLLGVELQRLPRAASFLLRFLSAQEHLAAAVVGYLFHVHRIRIAPTLSDRFTLRLEPSAFLEEHAIERFLAAMDDVCRRLQRQDALGLTGYLLQRGAFAETFAVHSGGKCFARNEDRFQQRQRAVPPIRVAWLCHFIDADDLTSLEPAFGEVSLQQRENYLQRLAAFANPVVLSAVDIRSPLGAQVRLYPILLPVTSGWMKQALDRRRLATARAVVQQGIDVARSLGCQLVALGQYTSIVTGHGTSLAGIGIGLTTGNSYSIALIVQALERAHRQRGSDSAGSTLAVVGAAGNIGRTCVEMLAPCYRRTLLVGSSKPASRGRLERLAQRTAGTALTADLAVLRTADVVIAATSAVNASLTADHFGRGAIVCDISVPASVSRQVRAARPDLRLIEAGRVRLPGNEDLEIAGFPLPVGHTYGCMAEGILLGLEEVYDTSFTGWLRAEQVQRVAAMAQRHGFQLAEDPIFPRHGSQGGEVVNVPAR